METQELHTNKQQTEATVYDKRAFDEEEVGKETLESQGRPRGDKELGAFSCPLGEHDNRVLPRIALVLGMKTMLYFLEPTEAEVITFRCCWF